MEPICQDILDLECFDFFQSLKIHLQVLSFALVKVKVRL